MRQEHKLLIGASHSLDTYPAATHLPVHGHIWSCTLPVDLLVVDTAVRRAGRGVWTRPSWQPSLLEKLPHQNTVFIHLLSKSDPLCNLQLLLHL